MFIDRYDAGKRLGEKLVEYKGDRPVVLAIPSGGLPVAVEVAKSLNAALEVVLIKKLGHPFNREYAIGAVSLDDLVLSHTEDVTEKYIEEETHRIRTILRERYKRYYNNRTRTPLKNRTVIVVDDGIATGHTVMATVELVRKQEAKKIVVAIPVAPKIAIENLELSPFVDEVVCLSTPGNFRAVGQFYRQFRQLSEEEALSILEEYRAETQSSP